MSEDALALRIVQMRYEAQTIVSLELAQPDGGELPPFTAGAHVDLQLSPGCTRSYSLLNDQAERLRYVIAVHRDPDSRGGSRAVHESLRVGDIVRVSGPRNTFQLHENASHSVLIAGGVGVTPLLGMVRRLESLGRSWTLHYCARTRESAAFVDELQRLDRVRGHLRLNFDGEPGGALLDFFALVNAAPAGAHFYCCGPISMLEAFERATARIEPERVHLEYFSAKQEAAVDGDFELVLARSGRTLHVAPGQTILAAILAAKVDVNYACSEGVCGTCLTRVVEGVPDHRDNYLNDDEKAGNEMIMVCCSGSKSARLVLDL